MKPNLIDNTEGRHFALKDDGIVVIKSLTAKRLDQLERGLNINQRQK